MQEAGGRTEAACLPSSLALEASVRQVVSGRPHAHGAVQQFWLCSRGGHVQQGRAERDSVAVGRTCAFSPPHMP